jgi:hypothetical protein
MPRHPQQRVDTLEAIAVALAVYRQQGNRVVKFDNNTLGNKELIVSHFAGDTVIAELDLEAADLDKQVIEHQVMMASISTKVIPEFTMVVYEAIKANQVSSKNFGVIAWVPKLADDLRKRHEIKDHVYRLGLCSRYIGREHDKITLTYTEIDTRYLSHYNTFVHTGHDEHDNLVHFYCKTKIPTGSIIHAKVKSHAKGRHALQDANVTYLNYVKEEK